MHDLADDRNQGPTAILASAKTHVDQAFFIGQVLMPRMV
jgi:hypothetical protein